MPLVANRFKTDFASRGHRAITTVSETAWNFTLGFVPSPPSSEERVRGPSVKSAPHPGSPPKTGGRGVKQQSHSQHT